MLETQLDQLEREWNETCQQAAADDNWRNAPDPELEPIRQREAAAAQARADALAKEVWQSWCETCTRLGCSTL